MDKKGSGSGLNSKNPHSNDDPVLEDDLDDEDDPTGDDNYCVYTYKGGHPGSADLPSSFMYLPDLDSGSLPSGSSAGTSAGLTLPGLSTASSNVAGGSAIAGSSTAPRGGTLDPFSPDMDFLEMDFDPGVGPGDEDDEEINQDDNYEHDSLEITGSVDATSYAPRLEPLTVSTTGTGDLTSSTATNMIDFTDGPGSDHGQTLPEPTPGPSNQALTSAVMRPSRPAHIEARSQTSPNAPGHPFASAQQVPSSSSSAAVAGNQSQRISPETPGLTVKLIHSLTPTESEPCVLDFGDVNSSSFGGERDVDDEYDLESYRGSVSMSWNPKLEMGIGSVLIWTLEECIERSLNQIGTSACGATAVCNVLKALEPNTDVDQKKVNENVGTRLRQENAEIPEYLFSRSVAGANHEDLIRGADKSSNGRIVGRFFRVKPGTTPKQFNQWILSWICRGAVPVVTRNLQAKGTASLSIGDYEELPDSWHHQMVAGMSSLGTHLTNPIEVVPFRKLLPELTTESVLLVRRADVISRMRPRTDLRRLARHKDYRWNQLNVLGQVGNLLLEEMPLIGGSNVARRVRSRHVTIPANYSGGVTLFVSTQNPVLVTQLQNAPDFGSEE